ncbi:hypothetical protein MPTK1_3g10630 [Marchantia polymorpha subsp. ruderalis]|uniref:AtTam37 zinc finger domain-containing protein n=4 Tax=Marchantia polymorpha TaxID=3197 RepID=A0AAF6AZF3_MARPO|nr:hypothetical protein MARPO_0037s0133 [Marchantia polymorpha]BBN05137.1 hypothetical protein Mp_3g10630 [Marchantia polymorpha subsp. ruderalis]|eukprot:PTQ40966.1 hypothetical protein MARPO_0037s0133 [Marchantia polymorpha]
MDKWAGEARKRAAMVAEVLKDAAFDLSWDVRDHAKTGFGVPKLVSSVASLGVATVAAAGVASVGFDLGGKFFGKRECNTCNGWEGLRCTMCRGSGKVRYNINDSSLADSERASSRSVAAAAMEGRADIEYIPASIGMSLPYPYRDCPACEATGVMVCSTCEGDSWKPKFNFDNIMNAPWQSWDVYRKMKPPTLQGKGEVIRDPAMAAFSMYGRAEAEQGIALDEDVKEKMMYNYQDAREYDYLRERIERREPGWENMQEVLFTKDPERALSDPVIISDPAYYTAKQKIQAEVHDLPVPPTPAEWMNDVKYPLSEADWSKNELKDPRAKTEMDVLLRGQEQFYKSMKDRSWAMHWRKMKAAEVTRNKINSFEHGLEVDSYQSAQPEALRSEADVASTAAASSVPTKVKRAVEKTDAKKRPDDEKKKRERQERAERMARQAAEREAALAKAKAARERKGAS